MNRRDFLLFLGGLALTPAVLAAKAEAPFPLLKPSLKDEFSTISGIDWKILIRWGEAINAKDKFGYNNDFIAFHPLKKDSGLLWVNHEYMNSLYLGGIERTKENVDREMLEVGGSILEVKNGKAGWQVVKNSPHNRRLDANTPLPFAWDEPIKNSKVGIGTMANCAGGKTPWGTFLTCEENYDMFWGDVNKKQEVITKSFNQWDKIYPRPPEHYGWVVEINPLTGDGKKLVSLGRCAHECAAVTIAKSGKAVAYTGDDQTYEHLYKFISDSDSSLEKGKLYVANLEKGQWLSLDLKDQPLLREHFKSQTEVQIYLREAAKLLGATPLDRPEDIEFDPLTGHVFVALTNNKPKKNFHGSILKIMEKDNDPAALTFTHETFLSGGKDQGFACPDNMVFDPQGNLWFTTDISGYDIGNGAYEGLGNNGLFVFIRSGRFQGKVFRLASAPVQAELTGPCFSPDFKTLFLSVQHPGEDGTPEKPTSTWPDGGIPKPSVVTLTGPLLEKIVEGKL